MTSTQKDAFNTLCTMLQDEGYVEDFQHALHEVVFPGKTHQGNFNMIWAIECSTPRQWVEALMQVMIRRACRAQGAEHY